MMSLVSLTIQYQVLSTLKKRAFENILEEGENAGNIPFVPFSRIFSTLSKTEIII